MGEQPPAQDLTTRRGYHHGHLREALLEAARRLVAERGPQGFTVTEAAKLAGVSPAAVYRHFRDREALLAELCQRGATLFAARLHQASAARGLRGMGQAYLAFAREEPGYYAAMFSFRAAGVQGAAPPEDAFTGLVEAIRHSLPPQRQAGVDPRRLALQVWALSHGLAMLERAGLPPPGSGAPPMEELLESGVAALLR
jgi:AcrR family transcriptional regulator